MDDQQGKTFDAAYVSELREENAKWRTKFRDLESRFDSYALNEALRKEGIEADPKWVERAEGQSIEDAVTAFKAKYPHLVKSSANNTGDSQPPVAPVKPDIPAAPKPGSSTVPKGDRTLEEIKKDPIARNKLRDQYREMLRSGRSNTI